MKRYTAILGTLTITIIILISGSVVADWVYADSVYRSEDCTNPDDAVGSPDTKHATVGENEPVAKLGILILNMCVDHAIPPDTDFTVFADSTVQEQYSVALIDEDWINKYECPDTGYDDADQVFSSPPTPHVHWLYVEITGETGDDGPGDMIWGPEIDAVGWT